MPGYSNWKVLYKEEYVQLFEEGYPVGNNPKPDMSEEYLPLPADVDLHLKEEDVTEEQWEKAYWNLWKVTEKGIRPDFTFVEPEDFESIITEAAEVPKLLSLTEEEYKERISGAWFGRCAAVALGKPLEMGYDRKKIREYLESVYAYPLNDWVPARSKELNITLREDCICSTRGNVKFMQSDDDIHYTILALLLSEKKGLDFTTLDVGMNWLDNVPYHWFWCASRQIYYHLVNMNSNRPLQEQVDEMKYKLNPWRECIDGQLRGDFWGYITPGQPRIGAKYSYKDCSLSLVKNGVYGGMFVTGCISSALSKDPTVEKIIQGGLCVIPKKSRFAVMVKEVQQWYAKEGEWIPVCNKIYEKYGHLPFAGTLNNMAIVVLALIHGNLDFTKTITTSVMCGIDTDCTSGTAGSIVGAAVGYNGIEKRWIEPLNDTVKTVLADFGQGNISDLVKRTIEIKNKVM